MEAVLVHDWRHRRSQSTASGKPPPSQPPPEDSAEDHGSRLPARLQIDARCDPVPLPANRSTGVLLSASPSSTTGTAPGGASGASDAQTMIPVGEPYYNALREAWSSPPPPPLGPQTMTSALPPPTDVDSLDESFILDSIEQMEGPPLSPAVPLSYMIDLLTPQWEDEGLYDVARRREQRSQAVEQETGRRV